MIRKRADVMATNKSIVWRSAEDNSGKYWPFAVDNVMGTHAERATWLYDHQMGHHVLGQSGVYYFNTEEDAVLFHLAWGKTS